MEVSERTSVTLRLTADSDDALSTPRDEGAVDAVNDPGPESPPPRPSAEVLIARAHKRRSEGKRKQAAQAYRQILRAYPKRAEARVAAVSLGDLELQLGRGRAALEAYERYLAKPGPLTEEARLGRIRALRALGRRERERAAIEAFLSAHAKSWEAAALRKRLAWLRGDGG